MKDFVFNIKQRIESEIKNIQNSETHSANQIKQIISFIEERINELKMFIRNYSFKNEQEEILFFKELESFSSLNMEATLELVVSLTIELRFS